MAAVKRAAFLGPFSHGLPETISIQPAFRSFLPPSFRLEA